MKYADLHVHTFYSDSTFSPEEVESLLASYGFNHKETLRETKEIVYTKPEEYWEVEIPNSAPDNPSFLVSNSTISDGGLNLTNQTIAFNFLLNDTNSGNTLTWYVQPFNNSIAFEYYLTGNLTAV